jgi:glycerophosphoryl diester phosphodiesterase
MDVTPTSPEPGGEPTGAANAESRIAKANGAGTSDIRAVNDAARGRRSRPIVVAHRGSSAALPEHTIGAYMRAIAEGADGLECDVRLTRDGHLVCIHDGRLNRVSNGTGRVSRRVLAELDELDFGSWHPGPVEPEPPIIDPAAIEPGATEPSATGAPAMQPPVIRPPAGAPVDPRTRVLTLERLLDAAVGAGRPLQLLIETKHPTRYGAEVEDRLVAMLRWYGLDKPDNGTAVRVTLMSFSELAMRRIHPLAPDLDRVLLTEFVRPDRREGRLPIGANVAGPGVRVVKANPGLVAAWHRRGHRVFVWTVNEPRDVDLMMELGVDAIITDRPRMVLDRIGG